MNELAARQPEDDDDQHRHPDRETVSHALTRQAAAVAVRLANLVEDWCSPESGAPAATSFLREWAASTGVRSGASPTVAQLVAGTPIARLASRLQLTDVELDLLVLAGLSDEHEGLASTLRTLHPGREPHPTVGVAALVVAADLPDRASLRRLLHEGRAARSGLLTTTDEGTFFERSLVVADQVWEALHDLDAWPARLARVDVPPTPGGLANWLASPAVDRALTTLRLRQDRLLLVGSGDEAIAISRCAALANAAGEAPVAARLSPQDPAAMALLSLHAAVRGAVPIVVSAELADGGPAPTPDLSRVLTGPVMLCAAPGAVRPPVDRPVVMVPLGPIGIGDRRAAWQSALSGASDEAADLAARHPLDPAMTALVALDIDGSVAGVVAGSAEPGGRPIDLAEVSVAIRARAGIALPAGVELLTPRAEWKHLVLGEDPAAQLKDAVTRLRYQSQVLDDWGMRETARADRGVRMLFSGPPGTGKSLAAEVVASAASTDLLVVDVSRVVSKWLGETEKNLAAIFDVAERTQAVLFLDEADALFAARTEISDAHDRYANLETSWLLQRLDRFDGLAVLATNLRRNIDAAFVRRMDYVVEFGLPDEESRTRIWDQHLPARLRAPDVDLPSLVRRHPVPGAWIRNAAIAAAFLAASDGGAIHQEHLVVALRREYAKATRPFPDEPPTPAEGVRDDRAARLLATVAVGRKRTETLR